MRRIYGDISGCRLSGWDGAIRSLAILQHQQRSNTTGKNAADIALVIDAMDMMRKGGLDEILPGELGQRFHAPCAAVCARTGSSSTASASASPRTRCATPARGSSIWRTSSRPSRRRRTGAAASGTDEAEKKESPRKAVKIIERAIEDSDDAGWVNHANRR